MEAPPCQPMLWFFAPTRLGAFPSNNRRPFPSLPTFPTGKRYRANHKARRDKNLRLVQPNRFPPKKSKKGSTTIRQPFAAFTQLCDLCVNTAGSKMARSMTAASEVNRHAAAADLLHRAHKYER